MVVNFWRLKNSVFRKPVRYLHYRGHRFCWRKSGSDLSTQSILFCFSVAKAAQLYVISLFRCLHSIPCLNNLSIYCTWGRDVPRLYSVFYQVVCVHAGKCRRTSKALILNIVNVIVHFAGWCVACFRQRINNKEPESDIISPLTLLAVKGLFRILIVSHGNLLQYIFRNYCNNFYGTQLCILYFIRFR